MPNNPAWASGPEWEGWDPHPAQPTEAVIKGNCIIWEDASWMYHTVQKSISGRFPSLDFAREISNLINQEAIEAIQAGKTVTINE